MPERILLALSITIMLPLPVSAQAFMEAGGVYAGVAGLGAGLAASQNHGQALKSSYELAIQAQQALVAQNKAISQYIKLGTQYEAKKDWVAAEKCFKYVLQVVNRRDGPGSVNGLPALKHLVTINVAQNKIDDAIGLQKTVVAFTQAAKKADPQAVIKSKLDLSNLFIQKGDYASAEPVLQQTVANCSSAPATSCVNERKITLRTYSQVLRKLKKDSDADAIDANLKKLDDEQASATQDQAKSDGVTTAVVSPDKSIESGAGAGKLTDSHEVVSQGSGKQAGTAQGNNSTEENKSTKGTTGNSQVDDKK